MSEDKIHYEENVYDDAIGHFINGKYQRCYDTKEEDHQEALVNLLNEYETQLADKDAEIDEIVNISLMSIVLTQDYNQNPFIEGWTWYDTAKKLSDKYPHLDWAKQFYQRCEAHKLAEAKP